MNIEISESHNRLYQKLYQDLGEDIRCLLSDKTVNEIMVNPDGQLWVDSIDKGLVVCGEVLPSRTLSIIHAVAGLHGFVVTQQQPYLEAELPYFSEMRGERFTAQVPPIVSSPGFTIRKKSSFIFKLEDYVDTGRLTLEQATILRDCVCQRKNMLLCGGPGSGKTTFANALIEQAVVTNKNQRWVVLEDLPELRCSAPNQVSMLTSNNVDMRSLLRAAMRMRPDRILMGEVRGGEALDLLKAWNTGCPGGLCTVHANGAEEAVQRILDLSMETGLTIPPISLLAQTIDVIVFITRKGYHSGFVQEIRALKGVKNGEVQFEKLD